MASCGYCNQHKGKRTCPALQGAICSPCCGQHRLKEIDCPSDCVWLGGLSVVRDPARAPVPTKDAWSTAMGKLMAYAQSAEVDATAREAIDLFFPDGDRTAAEWEVALLVAFMTYGHRGSGGLRIIDRFLAARGRALTPAEAAAMLAQQRAWASLFEVTAVHAGVGLDLRDLVSGEAIHVREVSGTAQVKRWDVMFAWIVDFPDRSELTGASCLVPRPHLPVVTAALDEELRRARRRRPGVKDRDLLGEVAWAPIAALREAFRDVQMPELHNMHGEKLMLCKAHYRSIDDERVAARLATAADLEPTDDGFVWLDRHGHPSLGEGPLTLGFVRVADGGVVLETNSRERLARGKSLIEATLAELVVHKADLVQDVESAMRERREKPTRSARENEIPEGVRRQIVNKYLEDYYERWIDEPLPALGGKSPRKAAKTRRGRQQVEVLIKEAENHTARMDGADTAIFDALRRELGLIAEEVGIDGYDASRAPDPGSWLATDDQVKAQAVEAYHHDLEGHPETPNPRLHALMHVIVENQLAGGNLPDVATAFDRLTAAGLTRHEAIHAVGSVVAEALWRVMNNESVEFDREVVARSLARLRPQQWASSVTE